VIKPEGPGYAIYSKFRIEVRLPDPRSDIHTILIFNVNSDIPLPKFHSDGADRKPVQTLLTVVYKDQEQFTGFHRFSGKIGEKRIWIETDRGIVFKGGIVGGPEEGVSLGGSGSWTTT
jgi:hypothetical protein